MVKKDTRKLYNQKRLELTSSQQNELSGRMVEYFRTLSLDGVQCLLSYHPINSRNEFNVSLCEQLLLLNNPSLTIAWPKLQLDDITMEAVAIDNNTVLEQNRYGIFEPSGNESISPQSIDAVFVPLLAFDIRGYRVGYGKGYYDRYLCRCAQDVMKIGFSYFEPVEQIEDVNEFDIPLNYCITPLRVYEF